MPDKKSKSTSAEQFYFVAKDYAQAAKTIYYSSDYSGDKIVDVVFPLGLLLGFSIELYLKSWLRQAGYSADELRKRDVGHSLRELHARSEKEGLDSIPRLQELVDAFHDNHVNFDFRYANDKSE